MTAQTEKWFKGHAEGTTYVVKNGLHVAHYKNLRGLVAYASKQKPLKVETRKCPNNPRNGELRITFADGAQGFAFFREHSILIDWVRNRRTLRHALIDHQSGDMGYLTKPGTIAGPAQ